MTKHNLLIIAILCLASLLILGAVHAGKNFASSGGDKFTVGGNLNIIAGGELVAEANSVLDVNSAASIKCDGQAISGLLKCASGSLSSITDDSVAWNNVVSDVNSNRDSWDTAYSWGDHAIEGYLVAESDPCYLGSASAGISSGDISNWDTAYENVIFSTTVDVNNSGLLHLYSAPKQLIAQPGSNKLIEILSVVVFLDYGSVSLTEPNDLNIQYATSNSIIVAVADTGLLDQTADTLTIAKPVTLAGIAASDCVNQAVELANSGTKEYEGATGTALKVHLTYCIRSGL